MEYSSFNDFYPFYLSQHKNQTNRRLHFVGSLSAIIILILSVITLNFKFLILSPIVGYAFAWVGHYFYEKNRPATFKYPGYSLMGDFRMVYEILIGKMKF